MTRCQAFALPLLLSAIFSAHAWAAPSRAGLLAFFEGLEGGWSGQGTVKDYTQAFPRFLGYRTDSDVTDERDEAYKVRSDVRYDNGLTEGKDTYFQVRGDQLYVSTAGGLEPVRLIDATPTRLAFSYERIDPWSRRIYVFQQDLVLNPFGQMEGHGSVSLNGVVLQTDDFTLRKR